ncbi:SDR family NAD(P)-dependent oxidoreductase [Eilatimonas milleporae]|uniref:NAD(P)-dependent dehydrogenase (Short-subunit alcohol dehydrogenase family) n=1 Tax=Eilatimonas milleporae TaxID=911205 RepID=A0A3M0CEL4_9PROT|nr:SDR family NAD(P)-dependent oxidoreductase [Eilatimonas milleporae]RMB08188.1 NAD(P)-dependent dehydrogenase (short-subunit alcohol dehydrogenase family) [Eilatimonas milleporae]
MPDRPGLFSQPVRAAVVGAGGGIGGAFVRHIAAKRPAALWALSRRKPDSLPPAARWLPVDILDEDSIADAAGAMGDSPLDLVIVATGILHAPDMAPEKTMRALTADALARAYAVNAIGPALVAKHMLPRLARDRTSVFAALSARVGSISDNRLGGWHAYRASKAALNQLIRTLSVELAMKNKQAICVGLHPGTVDTGLSDPFQSRVPEGKLFTPDFAAEKLLAVLTGLTSRDSGRLFAWDGAEIAP